MSFYKATTNLRYSECRCNTPLSFVGGNDLAKHDATARAVSRPHSSGLTSIIIRTQPLNSFRV
ncbi:hypothetical protein M378DRAFT_28648 [Amanita muscaria Koide BX008]|uniref:Uncharacterized protein n=1 Tax=Amanita muscaria (strain Koide BX008) TaxID=946122 RepID=A0A0C2RX05_AMAMK|nr:hypothetical protein M378DRAFT_28648 [Amanita muscaria Koide BX008]